jgi:hypothetical protein
VRPGITEFTCPSCNCHWAYIHTSFLEVADPDQAIPRHDGGYLRCDPCLLQVANPGGVPTLNSGLEAMVWARRYGGLANGPDADRKAPGFAKPKAPLADWMKRADELIGGGR